MNNKSEIKISTFVISLLLVGLIMTVLSGFIIGMGQKYNKDSTDLNLTAYNKMETLTNQALEVKGQVINVSTEQQNIFDILGKFFSGGLKVVRTTAQSFDVANTMVDQSFSDTQIYGDSGSTFKTFIGAILIILIFVGIILSIILKWWV